jgi:hypothetical protein
MVIACVYTLQWWSFLCIYFPGQRKWFCEWGSSVVACGRWSISAVDWSPSESFLVARCKVQQGSSKISGQHGSRAGTSMLDISSEMYSLDLQLLDLIFPGAHYARVIPFLASICNCNSYFKCSPNIYYTQPRECNWGATWKKQQRLRSRNPRIRSRDRHADHVAPSIHPQKLALNSPTGGGRSVGIVRSRTRTTELVIIFFELFLINQNYIRFYKLICCDSYIWLEELLEEHS